MDKMPDSGTESAIIELTEKSIKMNISPMRLCQYPANQRFFTNYPI